MRLDAEAKGAQFATEDDPRAYPFGAKMRKTRIDELPQLWNVLKGDLHFVGPRPERMIFTEQLEKEIPFYHERHLVKPGITGWAQVNGLRGETETPGKMEARVKHDVEYIENWTLFLDIKILFMTAFVVFGQKTAY